MRGPRQRAYSEERRRERQDSQTARESIVKRGGERHRQPDSQRERYGNCGEQTNTRGTPNSETDATHATSQCPPSCPFCTK